MTGPRLPQDAESRQPDLSGIFPAGSPIAKYLRWTKAAHGSPAEYNVAAILVASITELARRGFRLPKVVDVGEYPLSIWIVLLGESSTGKSTALSAIQDFMRHCWTEASIGLEPDPWIEPEGSPQGLVSVLQEHFDERRSTTVGLLYHHEFAAMLQTKDAVSELICKLADGRTMELNFINRQKSKTPNADRLINPRVSALLCTTEAQLAPHFKASQRLGGLFTRFIWEVPTFTRDDIRLAQDHAGAESARALRDEAIDAMVRWFASLSMLSGDKGYNFVFSEKAHQVLEEKLFVPWKAAYTSKFADENMHGVRMRLLEKARILSALHASWRGTLNIGPEDVEVACQIVMHYHSRVQRVTHFGASEIYLKIQHAEELVRLTNDIGIYRRDLYRQLKCDKKTLDAVVDTLIDAGLVFPDFRKDSAGKLIHVLSSAGREAKRHAEAKAAAGAVGGNQPWHRR